MGRDSKRILVVDDDRAARELLADILALRGHQISTASNPMDAFAILKGGIFDLVISDVNMPDLDGPRFYLYAKEDYPYLKDRFLFVTSLITRELHDFLDRADLQCVEKPFKLADFLHQVDVLLLRQFHDITGLDKRPPAILR